MVVTMTRLTLLLCLSTLVILLAVGHPLDSRLADDDVYKRNHDDNMKRDDTKNNPLPPPLTMSQINVEKDIPVSGFNTNDNTETLQLPIEGDIAIPGLNANNREELTMRVQRQGNPMYKRDTQWKWKKTDLTWRLYNLPSSRSPITPSQVVSDIQTAVSMWSSVTPLTFERVYEGKADIRISFAAKEHGDGFQFDDRSGVAGHAFPPGGGSYIDGSVHLDDDEIFTDDTSGTNFLYVITHEIGHALGLFHSTVQNSIMQGWAMPGLPYGTRLPVSDARSIQDLYGKKPGMPDLPTDPPPTAAPAPFNCKGDDYAATVIRGSLFLFQNDRYWRFRDTSVDSTLITYLIGDPIQPYFKDLPSDIESAVTLYNGTTIYMKGSVWYSYNIRRPYLTQPGDLRNTDAAYYDARKEVTYLFKGKNMLKLNHRTKESSGWIPTSTEFEGLPANLSAAFTDRQGNRFFMKNDMYWKYDRTSNAVAAGYPKPLPASLCEAGPVPVK